MTREEAIESGIRQAWRHLVDSAGEEYQTPMWAAREVLAKVLGNECQPDEMDGVAVSLQLVAVEVAEIARKRREAEAEAAAT